METTDFQQFKDYILSLAVIGQDLPLELIERVQNIVSANKQDLSDLEVAHVYASTGDLHGFTLWFKTIIIAARQYPGSINGYDFVTVWRNPATKGI